MNDSYFSNLHNLADFAPTNPADYFTGRHEEPEFQIGSGQLHGTPPHQSAHRSSGGRPSTPTPTNRSRSVPDRRAILTQNLGLRPGRLHRPGILRRETLATSRQTGFALNANAQQENPTLSHSHSRPQNIYQQHQGSRFSINPAHLSNPATLRFEQGRNGSPPQVMNYPGPAAQQHQHQRQQQAAQQPPSAISGSTQVYNHGRNEQEPDLEPLTNLDTTMMDLPTGMADPSATVAMNMTIADLSNRLNTFEKRFDVWEDSIALLCNVVVNLSNVTLAANPGLEDTLRTSFATAISDLQLMLHSEETV